MLELKEKKFERELFTGAFQNHERPDEKVNKFS